MKWYMFSWFVLASTVSISQQSNFVDTFDNNDHSWPFLGSDGSGSLSIANGHLVMDAKANAIHTYKDVGLNEAADFAIYSRMIFLNGNHENYMGIRFMMSPDAEKYCSFVYGNDKGFLIATQNGKKREIIRESKSALIKATDYNMLTVIKKGNMYRFLINDKQVHEAKIKSFFGPMVALLTDRNMQIQVDELQVYDPQKGKAKTIPSTLASGGDNMQNLVQNLDAQMAPDFKQYYDSFEKFVYPYNYATVIERAHDVTNFPFVQKTFFAYEKSQISNHTVWAVAHLANCQNGYAFLMEHQYTINNQKVTRVSVEAFDKTGKSIGSKDVGSTVKEREGYFQTLDFRIVREGNSVFIEATTTFHNGNKQRSSVAFNTELCNL